VCGRVRACVCMCVKDVLQVLIGLLLGRSPPCWVGTKKSVFLCYVEYVCVCVCVCECEAFYIVCFCPPVYPMHTCVLL